MVLNCSKEDLGLSLGKLSKCRLALPREVVESPSLEGFKSRLSKHMLQTVWCRRSCLAGQKWTK